MKNIQVYRINSEAKIPTRNHNTDAGLDLYSVEDVFIQTGNTALVGTGVALKVSDGHVGKIEDRSSMGLKGLRTGAGVIDSGFSGEMKVVLHNLNNQEHDYLGKRGYWIKKGDKIAQLLIYKVEMPEIVEVSSLWNSNRGLKGFGSSGA